MDAPLRHTLPKAEKLCGKTAVSTLLDKGRYVTAGCLRVCFRTSEGEERSRILISVPKRNFKRAVKRNLLKRRIRESYRLQKSLLDTPCDLMFVYTPREVLPSADIFASMTEALAAVGRAAKR